MCAFYCMTKYLLQNVVFERYVHWVQNSLLTPILFQPWKVVTAFSSIVDDLWQKWAVIIYFVSLYTMCGFFSGYLQNFTLVFCFFFNSLNLTCLGICFVMLDVLWVLCSMVWWLSLILKNNFDHYFFKLFFLLCSGFYSGISITYIFECLTLFHSLEFLFMSFSVIFLIIQFG